MNDNSINLKGFHAKVIAVTPADGETCVAHIQGNGLDLKLHHCDKHPGLLHCYAKDVEGNQFACDYQLEGGETVNSVLLTLMENLVVLQSQHALRQKKVAAVEGQHVRH